MKTVGKIGTLIFDLTGLGAMCLVMIAAGHGVKYMYDEINDIW